MFNNTRGESIGEIWVATKTLILFNKRALIIQRSNYCRAGENEWEFAGGGLKFGEDLMEGLLREAKEEVGITVQVERLLYAVSRLVSPERQIVGLTYLCYANTDKVILSNEHKAFLWATRNQLMELLNNPMLNDLSNNSIFDMTDIV